MPAFVMGGLALASGVMGAMGSAGQAKAQAQAQRMQQESANFTARMNADAQNRNALRQWQTQQQVNYQIEQGANRNLVRQEFYGTKAYQNNTSLLSKQTAQTTANFLGSSSARGLSIDSASARALVRQAANQAQLTSEAMRVSDVNAREDMGVAYNQMLAQRRLGPPQQLIADQHFGGMVDNSQGILMTGIATSVLGAASVGYEARKKYG